MKSEDLHWSLERGIDLSRTLSKYEERTLTKDLTFQFHYTHYKVLEQMKGFCLGRTIEIRTHRKDNLRIFIGNGELNFNRVDEVYEQENRLISLQKTWSNRKTYFPEAKHP